MCACTDATDAAGAGWGSVFCFDVLQWYMKSLACIALKHWIVVEPLQSLIGMSYVIGQCFSCMFIFVTVTAKRTLESAMSLLDHISHIW